MEPTSEQIAGLNIALNEARLLQYDFDHDQRRAIVQLGVVVLLEGAAIHSEKRIELRLVPIGRVAATLIWDGVHRQLELSDIAGAVKSFGALPIYGWEFIDPPSDNLADWSELLSLDFRNGTSGMKHALHLFQENERGKLDLCLWFDELDVGGQLTLDELIVDGKRWWDAVSAGDPRAAAAGFHPSSGGDSDQ